jgi:hypothetical protein
MPAKLIVGVIALCGGVWAQSTFLDQLNPFTPHGGGIHLYDISVYSSYNSAPLPFVAFQRPGQPSLGHEIGYGASTGLGWTRLGARSSIALTYTVGYSGRVRYSDWNSLNHSFSLSARWKPAARWETHLSATAAVRNIEHYMFSPTILSQLAAAPATFDELAAAMVAGKYTNDQLASLLTGAPLVESPAQTFLFGDRVLVGGLQAGASYSKSPRMTVHFGAGGSRVQQLDSGLDKTAARPPVLLAHATSGNVGMGVSYSLSPRTQIGVDVATHHVFSSLTSTYGTTITASVGRTMGRRWLVTGHGGGAFVTRVRDAIGPAPPPHYVFGGSLGVKFSRHTFVASHDRSITDVFGLGASYGTTSAGAWHWKAGGGWAVSTSAGWQQLSGSQFMAVRGTHAMAGASHSLTRMMSIRFGVAYMDNSVKTAGTPFSGSFYSATVALSWRPAF